jgi:Ca2+-binding RTX toxin-like protein
MGPTGPPADTKAMRVRVLVLGLVFFASAIALAVAPHVAVGHTPDLSRPCTITGTGGADLLAGTPGPDVICGLGGNDVIGAGGGNDIIRAGAGADRIQGDGGKDVLWGGRGNDWIWSRDGGHDHVHGGPGYDRYRVDKPLDVRAAVEAVM